VPGSSALALQRLLFGADPVLAWTEARSENAIRAAADIRAAMLTACSRNGACNGFRQHDPGRERICARLQANLPSAVVKHTRSGNWLRGIEIQLQDQKTMKTRPGDDG